MAHKKGRTRKPTHVVDMTGESAPGSPWTPELDQAEEDSYPVIFRAGVRLFVRMAKFRGRMQEFALVLQAYDEPTDEWRSVARADCAHGQDVHIDFLDHVGRTRRKQLVQAVTCESDVLTGYKQAYAMLYGHAEAYLRDWRGA